MPPPTSFLAYLRSVTARPDTRLGNMRHRVASLPGLLTLPRLVKQALLALAFVQAATSVSFAEPVITELMSSNKTVLKDENGDYSDWIEIYNPDATAVNLDGWYLTDNAAKKDKWRVPAVTLQPGAYLVVFASDKNRQDPAATLHTNFSLSSSGEYLGLIKPDASTVASEYAPKFPALPNDISYGTSQLPGASPTIGFFDLPTPNAQNGNTALLTLPERVTFSRAPGPFTGSITVELRGAPTGAKIRYVVAGPSAKGTAVSDPTATSTQYTGPITLDSSSILRAAVFSSDDLQHGLASSAHYEQVVDAGAQRIDTFVSQLPILVIDGHGDGPVEKDEIDHAVWLHVYAPAPGNAAVTPLSTPTLSSPVTATVRGSSSAEFPKKSYNFTLKDQAGADSAQPLLDLGSSADWALVSPWHYDPALIRNAYVYALSNRLGRWAPRTRFAELFVSPQGGSLDLSHYIGLTVITDRIKIAPDRLAITALATTDVTAPAITGGYILKIDAPDAEHYSWVTDRGIPSNPGGAISIDTPKASKLSDAQRDYIRDYVQQMENALHADRDSGWATRNHLKYLDRASWIDHHLLEVFVKNVDAFQRSEYLYKDRGGKLVSGPAWDFDRSMGSVDGRDQPWSTWSPSNGVDVWDFGWWGILARDPEFMQAWIDRWQNLRRGALATENLGELAENLAAQIGPDAAARDAARWPDNEGRFPGGFGGEIAYLKEWITNRAAWIDQQFVNLPTIVSDGSIITITPAAGAQLAYTLNGADPRTLNGGLSASAQVTTEPLTLGANANFNVRSFNPAATAFPGTPWSASVTNPDAPRINGDAGDFDPSGEARLAALSSRGHIGLGENILIAGVAVSGTAPKRFLVRAVGPTIGELGVPDTLPDPTLRIFTGDGTQIAANTGWETGPDPVQLIQLSNAIGVSPFALGSRDSALIVDLPPGGYSVQVSSETGQTGVGLAEIYEVNETGKAIALSTRGQVRTGGGILIGGLVVRGANAKRLLIRGTGPSLANQGVAGALSDPTLTLYQGPNALAVNDDWSTSDSVSEINAATVVTGVPAFTDPKDSAMVVTLEPGVYTVQLAGKNNAEGVGLLEIYELPASAP
ncbi:MAG TPA: CotH kinase family protein [Opitutaceae bacterium]|nr:CotH kinase family protein [Opitutaceae bacterium]